jgi:hypothetical protein
VSASFFHEGHKAEFMAPNFFCPHPILCDAHIQSNSPATVAAEFTVHSQVNSSAAVLLLLILFNPQRIYMFYCLVQTQTVVYRYTIVEREKNWRAI